ncbi:glycosyltransferase family 4 protein [Janibacter cremeus]|uniref:glycosyltransferase family 4 protein n=1 Tax=Janibacter cremeus TaxID=1285192 RepID=UPI0023F89919|nr:glycosyltransferase family 4 protein [Janibacter cremeus]WEV78219.1 glycosyltransferase family 4 protein [Janibacter cremeus]WEV78299.1 glycosyltransferase family 4 protein [Janibacter cremeus]
MFLFRTDRIGGSERRAGEVASLLRSRGTEVIAVNVSSGNSAASQFFKKHFTTLHPEKSVTSALKRCSQINANAVVTYGMRMTLPARALSVLGIISGSLYNARNGLDMNWPTWWHALDRATQAGNKFLANSQAVKEHLIAHGIAAKRIHVLPPALPDEWFSTLTPRTKRPLRIAMIGNHRPEKNQVLGVRAFLSSRIRAELIIYTDSAEWLPSELARWEIPELARVQAITNHTMEPSDYDEVDVVLHTSLSESVPRVLLEAASRGCRIIATDVGSTDSVLQGTVHRLLSPEPSMDEVTQALLDIAPSAPLDAPERVRITNSWTLTAYSCAFLDNVLRNREAPSPC